MAKECQKQLIILGAGIMQGPVIMIAKEMGLEAVAVDGNPHAPCASLADRFEPVDLKDKEGIEALGRSLQKTGTLGGIMTAGTDFSATAAWVAEKLGLPGVPYEAALNASDKGRMRRCFQQAGLPSPEFLILPAEGHDQELPIPFGYPAVVKPVDNMGGRGCRSVDSPEDLEQALPDVLRFSRSRRAILEAYMDGPEFSIDALIFKGRTAICGLADRHIFFPPYFIEMGHTMPANLRPEQIESLIHTFIQGIRALGLLEEHCCGAAKGDLKLTSRGPMIGEIAARLSGGYMSGWTYPYAAGVEPIRGAIAAALGTPPPGLTPVRAWTCAERAFISIPGTVRTVQGAQAAKAMPYVKDVFLRVKAGDTVRFPENNVAKCGNIIAAAPLRETALAAAEAAARRVLIRLEAPDRETQTFLNTDGPGASAYPPDAFAWPGSAASLAELPRSDMRGLGVRAPSLIPFPAFTGLGLRDYTGRTAEETLEAVRGMVMLPLAELPGAPPPFLGREFWAALIRGGYQGAAYILDCYQG
ncbi:MAG: ATP-grasp domain-containing protein [Treponema sp.]|nr:ATP-grasp domain-containing protein [Treponema sp.]